MNRMLTMTLEDGQTVSIRARTNIPDPYHFGSGRPARVDLVSFHPGVGTDRLVAEYRLQTILEATRDRDAVLWVGKGGWQIPLEPADARAIHEFLRDAK